MSRSCACDRCLDWFNPVPHELDEGENSEPITFSRTACDIGGGEQCHLAGERYIVHELNDAEEMTHFEICVDCYLRFHGVFEEVVA